MVTGVDTSDGLASSRLTLTSDGRSRLSLWSTDSVLSIASHGSVLSIASIGSLASVASIGSAGSVLSVGSAASAGSGLSWMSRWSLLADRSRASTLSSGRVSHAPAGPPAALAVIAAASYLAYLLERQRVARR